MRAVALPHEVDLPHEPPIPAVEGRMHHYASKRDGNEHEILSALLAVGCSVQSLAACRCGVPDLLVWSPFTKSLHLLEVKAPENHSVEERAKPEKALTRDQRKWHGTWRGEVAIVWDAQEALAAVGAKVP